VAESQLGVGVVKIKVDFKGLDAELDRVKTRVRKLALPKLVLRIDKKRLNDDLQRVHKMITGVTMRAKKPIHMRIDTRAAHEKIRNLRRDMARTSRHGALNPAVGGGGGVVMPPVGGAGVGVGKIAAGAMLGNIGADAITGAGRAAAGFVTSGIMDNAEVEMYRNSLKVLLKDQEKANKLFKELQQMDLELPVDIGMLAQNAQKLAGAGFDPEKIEGLMRVLMDTAAISPMGTNEGTSRIVRAFTQIRGKGNVQLEDLNQISELGVPIRQVIQEQFGMSAQELGDKTRDGSMTVDEALEGIVEGLNSRFGGSLEERATTLGGMLDQVHDRFKALRREMMEPFFESFRSALTDFTTWLRSEGFQDLQNNLEGFSRLLVDYFGKDFGDGGSAPTPSDSNSGWDPLRGLTAITGEFDSLYDGIARGMNPFSSEFDEYKKTRALMEKQAYEGNYSQAYYLAKSVSDTESMNRFRAMDPKLDKQIRETERLQQEQGAKYASELMGGRKLEEFQKTGDVALLGEAADKLGFDYRGFASGASSLLGQVGKGGEFVANVGSMFQQGFGQAQAGYNAQREEERKRKEAMETALNEDSFRRDDAQNRLAELIAANPELAGSELTSQLVKNKDGSFSTKFGIGKMAEAGGVTQTTDFASLNKMVQGQVDQASVEENTKRSADLLQNLVDDLNDQRDHRSKLEKAMEKSPISVVAP
jgi:tape measure domain-containing protein